MSTTTIYELIGYAASILIVVSLAMSSVIRLRIVNLVGALVFTLYGALIGSLPVLLTNIVIAGIDVYYLRKELTTRGQLGVVAVEGDDGFLASFVDHHAADLATYASGDPTSADVRYVLLRDTSLAGVFLGRSGPDGRLDVLVDYVAPPFRDLRSGASLYRDDGRRFADLGYRTLVVEDPDERQRDYFAAMGFGARDGSMVKHVG